MVTDRTGIADALGRLARERDPEAWAFLIERCGPASERLALRLAGSSDLAQDAVQEAWLQIRDGARGFAPRGEDPDAGAWGWIMRVTANATLQWMRRHRREPRQGLDDLALPEAVPMDPALADAVRTALAALPEDQRTAVVLHHVSGLDFGAVAAAMGCSQAAAKMRAHRALAQLRRQVRPAGVALSLLALTSAVSSLPAAEPVGSPELASLLTSGAKAQLGTAPAIKGFTMSMKIALAAASIALVAAGTMLVAQDGGAPAPPEPKPVPKPAMQVPSGPGQGQDNAVVEIVPKPVEVPDGDCLNLKNAVA